MNEKDIAKLAAELAAGAITTQYISSVYGPSVLSAVLGLAGGIGVGYVVGDIVDDLWGLL
jgi:hypothetical protein